MRNFRGIRYAQTELLEILTSDEYKQGTLAQKKQEKLDALIEFCGAYEKHREIQEMCDADFEHYWNIMDVMPVGHRMQTASTLMGIAFASAARNAHQLMLSRSPAQSQPRQTVAYYQVITWS